MSKTTLTDLCFHQGGIEPHRPATIQDLIEAVESIGGKVMVAMPDDPDAWAILPPDNLHARRLILRLDDSDE